MNDDTETMIISQSDQNRKGQTINDKRTERLRNACTLIEKASTAMEDFGKALVALETRLGGDLSEDEE